MDWDVIVVVLMVAIIVERLLEAIGEPFWALIQNPGPNIPNIKRIVSIAIGSVVGWATGLNAIPAFTKWPAAGYILTAVMIGAGSAVIHSIIATLEALQKQAKANAALSLRE